MATSASAGALTPLGNRAIIRTDPELVREFIKSLRESFGIELDVSYEDIKSFDELIEKLTIMEVDTLLKTYAKVESLIVPPDAISTTMKQLLKSMILVYKVRLEKNINDAIAMIKQAFENKSASKSKERVIIASRLLYYRMKVTPAVMSLLTQKIFSILSVNAPAALRSPIANMMLGQYDIVDVEEKRKGR